MKETGAARALRRFGLFVLLGACACIVASCNTGINAGKLQGSLSQTFANLYVLQQSEEGVPAPSVASLNVSAHCEKGIAGAAQNGASKKALASVAQNGAGNDWVCYVTYTDGEIGVPVTATYDLNVLTDGCYSADSELAATVTTPQGQYEVEDEQRTIPAPGGGNRVLPNPLWLIQGCFDVG